MKVEEIVTTDTKITNSTDNGKNIVTVENRENGTKFTAYKGENPERARRMVTEIYAAIQKKLLTW